MSDFLDRHGHRIIAVAECGCWIWMGALDRKGYGRHGVPNQRRTASAHRSSFASAFGPIPDGLGVCHRCDVPACVNPDHLFLGTQQDNAQDMARKGRHGRARLDADQASAIKLMLRSGQSHRTIAASYGVDRTTITQISRNKTWGHIQ